MGDDDNMTKERLALIEPELRIRLIFLDHDIAVVDKPCNLRSVPGHLHPQPSSTHVDNNDAGGVTNHRKRPRADAAEKDDDDDDDNDDVTAKSSTANDERSRHTFRSSGTTNRMTAQQVNNEFSCLVQQENRV